MKITHLIQMAGIGGAEIHLLTLLPELLKRAIEIEVVLVVLDKDRSSESLLSKPLREAGISVKTIYSPSRLNRTLLKDLHYHLVDCQILHTHLLAADVWNYLLKLIYRTKWLSISTKHNYDYDYTNKFGLAPDKPLRNKYYWLSRLAENKIDYSLVVSQGLRNLLIQKSICSSEKSAVVYHGIRTQNNQSETEQKSNSFTEKKKKNALLIVGRLVSYKGHEQLLRALGKLNEQGLTFHLDIVGSGPQLDFLVRLSDELGIADKLSFHGYVKEPQDFYKNATVSIVPSRGEGFGLVFLESMEHSLPLIAFDVPAANEIIVHNKTGLLAKKGSIVDLANCIKQLIANKELGNKMGRAGKLRLASQFSIMNMVNQTIAIYESATK